MRHSTPKVREFAERLVADELRGNSLQANPRATFVVCEKLRPQLAMLMGNAGFRALLSRSLALATVEVAWLSGVHVNATGTLHGLDEVIAQLAPREIAEGGMVLVTQLLGLLVAFIGEDLMVRLVDEAWPKLPPGDLNAGNRGKK
jgi:hypothetical protein